MARLALFDIDRTLVEVNSGELWIRHEREQGNLSLFGLARAIGWALQYRAGLLNFDDMARKALGPYRGRSAAELQVRTERFAHEQVLPHLCVQAEAALARHRECGDVLALCTSASHFMAEEIARVLDVPHVLCTRIDHRDGALTGQIGGRACYGPGKVAHAQELADALGMPLSQAAFYTDSVSDLALLEAVGEPIVVNPDVRLARVAQGRNWPVHRWSARPR